MCDHLLCCESALHFLLFNEQNNNAFLDRVRNPDSTIANRTVRERQGSSTSLKYNCTCKRDWQSALNKVSFTSPKWWKNRLFIVYFVNKIIARNLNLIIRTVRAKIKIISCCCNKVVLVQKFIYLLRLTN